MVPSIVRFSSKSVRPIVSSADGMSLKSDGLAHPANATCLLRVVIRGTLLRGLNGVEADCDE